MGLIIGLIFIVVGLGALSFFAINKDFDTTGLYADDYVDYSDLDDCGGFDD